MSQVSVILPTYNRANLVADAVRSVLDQTFPHWELIIVDDGSTDNTGIALQPLLGDRRIRYVSKSNGGAASARNMGLGLASGEFVAFIDSDDTWHPAKLEAQLDVLARWPEVDIVCSDFSAMPRAGGSREESHIKSYFSVFSDYGLDYADVFADVAEVESACLGTRVEVYRGNIYETMVFGNLILTSTSMFRRSVFGAVGVFDTSYTTLEDYDLLLRMTKASSVAFIDRPLILYRYSVDQLSGDRHFEQLCRNLDRIFEKNVAEAGDDFRRRHRRRIGRHRGMIQRQLGYYCATHGRRAEGAGHFWKSIAADSLNGKSWTYLALCYLPNSVIAGLRRLKSALQRG